MYVHHPNIVHNHKAGFFSLLAGHHHLAYLLSASLYWDMLLHSWAQLRHVCPHFLQWSTSCLSHSWAQASQMSAHRLQNCFANWLSIDISAADVQQTAAHSLFIWAQLAIILTSCSLRSEVAQNSQASAQRIQASIQLCHFVFWSVEVELIHISSRALYLSNVDRCNRT